MKMRPLAVGGKKKEICPPYSNYRSCLIKAKPETEISDLFMPGNR